jgi:hypothetical protein
MLLLSEHDRGFSFPERGAARDLMTDLLVGSRWPICVPGALS